MCNREPGASVTCELIRRDINAVVRECPTDLPAGSPRDPSCAREDKRAKTSEPETGSYLDSQTIAPLQAFTYPI